jgi:hypothetical protein
MAIDLGYLGGDDSWTMANWHDYIRSVANLANDQIETIEAECVELEAQRDALLAACKPIAAEIRNKNGGLAAAFDRDGGLDHSWDRDAHLQNPPTITQGEAAEILNAVGRKDGEV